VYRSPTIVVVIGRIAPAPTPWTPRKTISATMLQASPHSTEPIRKIEIPNRRTGFRPKTSESRP
jgi:hypothetical protein